MSPRASAWNLVGLGDSFTSSQDSAGRTYLDLFQEPLQSGDDHTVTLQDLSADSNTTARLLDQLRTDTTTRDAVSEADIILISVGGNDNDPFGVYPQGTCRPEQPLHDCLAADHAHAGDAGIKAIADLLTQIGVHELG